MYGRNAVVFTIGLTVLLSSSIANAWARRAQFAVGGPTLVLSLSELRSAYLVRANVVRYELPTASGRDVDAQLQRHFDVVLAILYLSTPQSIETALDRLESSRQTTWSADERAVWRRNLIANRRTQMSRLSAYRDRGLFPRNEGQSAEAAPIFVDKHNTACAVGHLMRLTGWERAVESIQSLDNLVYVPDFESGPVAEWVSTSGLTFEEAALIQPTYPNIPSELPQVPTDAARPLQSDWAGAYDDLRFSNFRFYRNAQPAPSVNVDVKHSFCSTYGCSILPRFEDYNGHIEHTGWFGVLPEGFRDFERVVVQFDVETLLPTQRFASKPQGSTAYTQGIQALLGQRNEIVVFAGATQDALFLHNLPNWEVNAVTPLKFLPGEIQSARPINFGWELTYAELKRSEFEPTRRMTVVTELLLKDGQPYQAQRLHFEVMQVPEPATFLSLIAALVAIGARRGGRIACGHGRNPRPAGEV
ncbi:MAG: hypothetical protein WD468_12540 [Pirellulales bacterium]